jgi:hypothetical protein
VLELCVKLEKSNEEKLGVLKFVFRSEAAKLQDFRNWSKRVIDGTASVV